MNLKILHLYPDLLNLYGDNGNITALKYRLEKRGIKANIKTVLTGDEPDFSGVDIVFIGGGSDREVSLVNKKLSNKKEDLKSYAENGGVLLAVCGGYQMLGESFVINSEKFKGLGILKISSKELKTRMTGNIICECDMINSKVAGFENHLSVTDIGTHKPFSKVIKGFGNDGKSGYEGVVYKNVIGTYLHGPLLPKNPKFTDYIISNALVKKYGKAELSPLDDEIENLAHNYAVNNL